MNDTTSTPTRKPDGIPHTQKINEDSLRLKALNTYVREHFPMGCDGIMCRYCVFYGAGVDTIEEYVCEMLYGIAQSHGDE